MKCLTLLQLLPLLQSALAAPLWPIPSQYALGAQVLWLASNVQVICPPASPKPVSALSHVSLLVKADRVKNNYSLATNSSKNAISSSTIIEAAIERTKQRLTGDNLVPWKFHPRNSNFQPSPNSIKASISRVTLTQNETDPENYYKPLAGGVDESYALKITTSGQVTINAVTSIGLLRGLETLTQLFYKHSQGGIYTPYAPVTITDAPKFPHRGLNMDVSRNYYPPADMKRTIDALSWNKFNRLHLHVVDAQSWPVEIPALPELAQKGPYHNGLTYSPKDLADIQEYGAYRGIEVIIEFDMPGHTAAIALAYPDLITAYNRADWSAGNFSAEPPSGQLKLGNQAVEAFLEELWNDFLPRVSPYTSYMHTGGDEVKANPYTLDPGVHTNDQSVITPLLQKFLDFNHDHVRKAGLTPMVWEEMLLHWNLKLGDDVVVQTWNGATSLPQTVAKGHKALAGDYNFWVRSFTSPYSSIFLASPAFPLPFFPLSPTTSPPLTNPPRSTSTAAKANGSTSPRANPPKPTTPTPTTAPPQKTGA